MEEKSKSGLRYHNGRQSVKKPDSVTCGCNRFPLSLPGARHMVKDHSDSERGNMGHPFQLAARVLLYASFHRQDNSTAFCYTSCAALAGMRNSSMGPP